MNIESTLRLAMAAEGIFGVPGEVEAQPEYAHYCCCGEWVGTYFSDDPNWYWRPEIDADTHNACATRLPNARPGRKRLPEDKKKSSAETTRAHRLKLQDQDTVANNEIATRNRDLEAALSTMFSYKSGEKPIDEDERDRQEEHGKST